MNKIASCIAFVGSLILFIFGFRIIDQSTEKGLHKALLIMANNQNVSSDTTDLLGYYLNSSIWTYKIEGIALIFIGIAVLFISSSLWKNK